MNKNIVFLSLILLALFITRIPVINSGLPYFYDEDEAHHFNRTVNMLSTGELNPKYFHKPSLHFYLRLPVLITSFFWTVKNGHILKLDEIKTKDDAGLAGYNFATSHPGIVKWQRAFSVILLILSLFVFYLIAKEFELRSELLFILVLVIGFSPKIYEYSAKIAVDMPCLFFASLTALFSLKYFKEEKFKFLIYALIFSGLTVSSKYNAFPVVLMPISALLLGSKANIENFILALVLPLISFFAASPFILVELPLFVNQFAYEIWHYGVAGHVGHMEEPGVKQFIHHFLWFGNSGLGWLAFIGSLAGLYILLKEKRKEAIVILSFPTIYFLLMVMQKANFERNMLVLIPFLALSLIYLLSKVKDLKLIYILALVLLVQPLYQVLKISRAEANIEESRIEAKEWIKENLNGKKIALSQELEFTPFVIYENGRPKLSMESIKRVNVETLGVFGAKKEGFEYLVLESFYQITESEKKSLELVKKFSGKKIKQRIIKNPEILIYKVKL